MRCSFITLVRGRWPFLKGATDSATRAITKVIERIEGITVGVTKEDDVVPV